MQNRAATPVAGVTFSARSKGAWGNFMFLTIEDGSTDPSNELRISVRRQTEPEVVPENIADIVPLEVHDNLSMDPALPNFIVTALNENSNLISAQVLASNTSLQRGLHRGGTSPALPLNERRNFLINLDSDGFQQVALPAGIAASTVLADVAAAIETAVRALGATKKKASTPVEAFNAFTCTVEGAGPTARLVLQSGTGAVAATFSPLSSVRVHERPYQQRRGPAQAR